MPSVAESRISRTTQMLTDEDLVLHGARCECGWGVSELASLSRTYDSQAAWLRVRAAVQDHEREGCHADGG